jgi:hypothetical protein
MITNDHEFETNFHELKTDLFVVIRPLIRGYSCINKGGSNGFSGKKQFTKEFHFQP